MDEQRKRGAGYTPLENLLICKAFISASEDPILGASQKGKLFKKTMHESFVTLLEQQETYDRVMLAQVSQGTRVAVGEGLIGSGNYDRRTIDSIYDRFKMKISCDVSKFLGVMDTTPKRNPASASLV